MKYWLVSPPSRRAVVLGVLLVGLALLAARAGIGLAAKDSSAPKAERDGKPPAAAIDKEKLRYEGKSFEQWRELMFNDLSPETRVKAMKAMGAFGRKGYGPEAAKAILKLMGDCDLETEDDDISEEKVLEAAAAALVKIGPDALALLQRGLQDANGKVRLFVIEVLPGFQEKAKPTLPALFQVIKTGDVEERLAAFGAVNCINKNDQRFVLALIEAVKDKETAIRRAAAQQLFFIDRNARKPALSVLAGALCDRDAGVRDAAEDALKDLVKELGPKAKDAIPDLIAALKGNECNELHEIVDMLANIGPAAQDAVPVLTQWLKTPPPKSRYPGLEDGFCHQGYSLEEWFQCRVYDALVKITGKKPSLPRPQRSESSFPSGYPPF
jgi:HEAT repeat protein